MLTLIRSYVHILLLTLYVAAPARIADASLPPHAHCRKNTTS